MKRRVYDMGWSKFTDIQEKAIPVIINTENDVILSAGTASGKTEAAFLPIFSKVEKEAGQSLKVLYISPLKALINNQYERLTDMTRGTYISVHRWHGDISAAKKKKFSSRPSGVLQITPESIESLFINRTSLLHTLFQDIDFIVVDEIHSFLDSERGAHLRSLLSRMNNYMKKKPRIIGLSATVDNYPLVKKWVNHETPENVDIIESPRGNKALLYNLMHFQINEDKKIPMDLFRDIRFLTRDQKSLIFCNRRGHVEEFTVMLNRLARKENIEDPYLAHHSSIDKKEREFVEKKMQETNMPRSVVSTSSLELGIDIGSIDIVIQIDNTFSVSSLKQRLGRSGRKQGTDQILQLYTTVNDSLLHSLSVMELVREKWVEPAQGYPLPYDILFHQIVSICKETNGLSLPSLKDRIYHIGIFKLFERERVIELINHMQEKGILELIPGTNEIIVGLEGENLLRGKEFYSMFMTTEEYQVISGSQKVGMIDKSPFLNIGDNFILAGKLWTIVDIHDSGSKVFVEKAQDGIPPKYFSGGGKVHKVIAEKMQEILCSNEKITYVDDKALSALKEMRIPYHTNNIQPNERVIWKEGKYWILESYTGTNIVRTLMLMLRSRGHTIHTPDELGRIRISGKVDFLEELKILKEIEWTHETLLEVLNEDEKFKSKYIEYLPTQIQKELQIVRDVEIEGTIEYLTEFKFRAI
ncbi:DEAD/DEAH box helicase [Halobacillus fulvus]|nr:DEAD/DEAH box helicase [Halobacillus fulvus]